jgi:hypothetical protein
MAATFQAFGAAQIWVKTNSTWSWLGFNRDRGDIRVNAHMIDVHSDEKGGDAGPPAEIQMLGQTAVVRCELSRWDTTVMAAIQSRINASSAVAEGASSAYRGKFIFANSYHFELIVASLLKLWYFTCTVPREPTHLNPGTAFSIQEVIFDAYEDPSTGCLYTTTAPAGFTTTTTTSACR